MSPLYESSLSFPCGNKVPPSLPLFHCPCLSPFFPRSALIRKAVGGGGPVGNSFDPLILPNAKFSPFYAFQHSQLLTFPSSSSSFIPLHHCLFQDSRGGGLGWGGGHGLTRVAALLCCAWLFSRRRGEWEHKGRSWGTISPRRAHQQLWGGWKRASGGFFSFADTVSLRRALPTRRLALISHTLRHLAPSPNKVLVTLSQICF